MEFELNLFYIHEYREIKNIYETLDIICVRIHKLYDPGYCDEPLRLDDFESLSVIIFLYSFQTPDKHTVVPHVEKRPSGGVKFPPRPSHPPPPPPIRSSEQPRTVDKVPMVEKQVI